MKKHRVKFEVLGKFYWMEVEATTPYGAIAAVEAIIRVLSPPQYPFNFALKKRS